MPGPVVHSLGHEPIADHSFSEDRSLLAVARNNDVELYFDTGRNQLQLGTKLSQHDKTVTSVDVAGDGKIVTCSQDRNALVWEPQADGSWKQTLVLLRINRAATFVRWSPDNTKFAVGSGARAIAVCYFEQENDWWVSKHIKKPIRSTVLSVDWHPNSVLLAAGSTDGHARVFSGFIKSVDQRPAPTVWGERLPFQTLCGDFTNASGGWVHDVAFSPSGDALGFVTHDSSIIVAYPGGADQPPRAVVSVNTSFLPFKSLVWTTESTIVAAGNDCHPVVFKGDESGWEYDHSIDDPSKSKKADSARESSALNMFRQLDLKGSDSTDSTELPTVHQNTITSVRAYATSNGIVTKISTSGVDGRVVIFDV
ncbi:Arc40p [Sugiyamaella lignohabitans]|uniref:Actin-related protein 2/3 complex subunit n=1 Tax=Sugiyamaella lignohabitans TaxID=796027 RepID=A0A167FG33_9ASCO|nr:Arc40p [Sugiyamaella lignohabitans]ANB15254.1 Arc40p [Sugiyamaella lignohabitans]